MKNVLITFVLFFAFALGVQAQDNKAYEAAMTKMLEVSKSMEAMKQIAPQITAMLKQQCNEQLPDEFLKHIDDEMVAMFGRMVKAMVPVYQKYLSLDDIKGVIAFYETPVGKKLADSNTKIAMDVMPIAQQVGMDTMKKLTDEMKGKGYLK